MAPLLSYREYPPPPDLHPWVVCLWEMHGLVVGTAEPHPVLPDGCGDILLDFAASRSDVAVEVVGPMTTAVQVPMSGTVELLGVRVRPGSLGPFLHVRADELVDRIVLPADIGMLSFDVRRLAGLVTANARRAGVIAELCTLVAGAAPRDGVVTETLSRWSVQTLFQDDDRPLASVADAVRASHLSERAFERRFIRSVGLPPSRMRRLVRFRAALKFKGQPTQSWRDVAARLGYADQAHLYRDFRAFAGSTPAQWWARESLHAGFVQDGQIAAL